MGDHECVRCPQCDSCPACAADALDREVEENERLRERLDQFEAYAITVKSALDDRNRVAELEEHDKSFSTVVARLATAMADRDALRGAMREIAGQCCSRNWYSGRPLQCPDIPQVQPRSWCSSCIARAALAGGGK